MKLILFDVDGTLVDSQDLIIRALAAAFSAHGLEPPTRERALSIVGLSLPEAFTVLVGAGGPLVSLSQAYRDAYNRLAADPANDEPLYPGAAACLQALHRRPDALLGLATGNSRRGVQRLLARHRWEHVFVTTQSADDAPSKPHPAMIEQAMREAGTSALDTIMIGDSPYDMAMARAAGALPIGVSWGFQPVDALMAAGAETIVDSYPKLAEALGGLLAPSNSAA